MGYNSAFVHFSQRNNPRVNHRAAFYRIDETLMIVEYISSNYLDFVIQGYEHFLM